MGGTDTPTRKKSTISLPPMRNAQATPPSQEEVLEQQRMREKKKKKKNVGARLNTVELLRWRGIPMTPARWSVGATITRVRIATKRALVWAQNVSQTRVYRAILLVRFESLYSRTPDGGAHRGGHKPFGCLAEPGVGVYYNSVPLLRPI